MNATDFTNKGTRRSRRELLRLTGAAAVAGGAATLVSTRRADAAGPLVGDGGGTTHGVYGHNPVDGGGGVVGATSDTASYGVLAVNAAMAAGGTAFWAACKKGTAVRVTETATGIDVVADGVGAKVVGGEIGIDAEATLPNTVAVYGHNSGGMQGVGVQGIGPTGVDGRGSAYAGVAAVGMQYGMHSYTETSEGSCLRLEPRRFDTMALKPGPAAKTGAHGQGELDEDGQGNLWHCVVDGTPGTWRKVSGPTTAGAFHPVTPVRVHDTRAFAGGPGPIPSGMWRTISVAFAPSMPAGPVVPAGATAIAYTITVVNTTGSGWLAVTESGTTTYTASTVNWAPTMPVVANSSVVKLGDDLHVKVYCGASGGPASTNFVIDLLGYYL